NWRTTESRLTSAQVGIELQCGHQSLPNAHVRHAVVPLPLSVVAAFGLLQASANPRCLHYSAHSL
ncbi:MAG TPA: hypothetical protein VFR18_19865, partial [Terriglobia bacterium]|nr:hypothetical protein [Terriglobia bacterium]